ncbi:hypothetical protein K435DRAFT_837653 [Dendrothele bispora CBS 962.96]|uniref:4-dimethylallyltryptophan N-methyltransferase n=1 Tax=Dendrothele bispora (strain CBS 962.96) TaxID=1314807 RepID=A0A4S8MAJ6_DENBC|nr:hypothetical protein K435DRAFT_837653 [Dendrothele bispora CBS 962.96]
MTSPPLIEIYDIRSEKDVAIFSSKLPSDIISGLSESQGQRTLPSECLYDEIGLKIYNEVVSTWKEYYPYKAEMGIWKQWADDIAHSMSRVQAGGRAVIIEFGAGSLDKTSLFLSALAGTCTSRENTPPITYYALDLSRSELDRTLSDLQNNIGQDVSGKIALKGLWGTYDDAIRILTTNEGNFDKEIPIHILFLGGTIGNFTKGTHDSAFLRSIPLNSERGDTLLLGLDQAKDPEMIERAYNFESARPWIMNGLLAAGKALGKPGLFKDGHWERYAKFNKEMGRFEAGYVSKFDQTLDVPTFGPVLFSSGEVIVVSCSNKYTEPETERLFDDGHLAVVKSWLNEEYKYLLCLLKTKHT